MIITVVGVWTCIAIYNVIYSFTGSFISKSSAVISRVEQGIIQSICTRKIYFRSVSLTLQYETHVINILTVGTTRYNIKKNDTFSGCLNKVSPIIPCGYSNLFKPCKASSKYLIFIDKRLYSNVRLMKYPFIAILFSLYEIKYPFCKSEINCVTHVSMDIIFSLRLIWNE